MQVEGGQAGVTLLAVAADSTGLAVACGYPGLLLRYDGSAWVPQAGPAAGSRLTGVWTWGAGSSAWAVAADGGVLVWNSAASPLAWAYEPPPPAGIGLVSVAGQSPSARDVIAAGTAPGGRAALLVRNWNGWGEVGLPGLLTGAAPVVVHAVATTGLCLALAAETALGGLVLLGGSPYYSPQVHLRDPSVQPRHTQIPPSIRPAGLHLGADGGQLR